MQQQDAQGMLRRHFFSPNSADDQQTRVWVEAQQKVQPFERLLVAPLQVVDQQQQRLRRGEHSACERLEESLALAVLGHRFIRRQIRLLS
jgi:hypothetical protein